MSICVGIDEAGRGPVIGPMVIAAVRCTPDQLQVLEKEGFSDSKTVSTSVRDEKRTYLEDSEVDFYTEVIPARDIEHASLTELSLDATSELINRAEPDEVLMDAPGHPSSMPEYLSRLRDRLDQNPSPSLTAEPGADDTYTIVSAASIIAKTLRDRKIEELKEQFGDLGSGYPSDPTTREFLKNHLSKDEPVRDHIRTRWSTFQDLLAEAGGPLYQSQNEEKKP